MGDILPPRTTRRSGRLLLVANRLPVTVQRGDDGDSLQPSAGGLAHALWPMHARGDSLWIGWTGEAADDGGDGQPIAARLRHDGLIPVAIPSALADAFYRGFSNSVLWPLFHYFPHLAVLDRGFWEAYRKVNQLFAQAVARVWRPGDVIWVHDYHLMLLPGMLRERRPQARIGFFLHTPFPSAEIFRILPWRREILQGVVGADLVGFHVYDYLRHFRITAIRVLGVEGEGDHLLVEGRTVRLGTFPVGIDAERFRLALARDDEARAQLASLPGELKGRRLVLGVDRMDYTKGIPERLAGYERFLERFPRHHGQVELIQIGVPTRTGVEQYRALRGQVEGIVGRINGRFGTSDWTPVKYIFRPVPFPRLCAFYRHAHVALVTPLRDGMNLVAKEYLACKADGGDGVLVLSEFAGAAAELAEALLVNPFDTDAIAGAIHRALTMPAAERRWRLSHLLGRLAQAQARPWGETFVAALRSEGGSAQVYPPRLDGDERERLLGAWRKAGGRALVLDYDGTLSEITPRPELARPDRPLLQLLRRLAGVSGVEIAVVSGRDRDTLDRWLGTLPVTLTAEHGRWLRDPGRGWEDMLAGCAPDWLPAVRRILDETTAATPGSFVEMKSASAAWHYRGANSEQADLRVRELAERLARLRADPPIELVHGKKVLEARVRGVSKGSVLLTWLAGKPAMDFLLVAGDDQTDEEMFERLPPNAWSVHVGSKPSRARWSLPEPTALRALLRQLCEPPREAIG